MRCHRFLRNFFEITGILFWLCFCALGIPSLVSSIAHADDNQGLLQRSSTKSAPAEVKPPQPPPDSDWMMKPVLPPAVQWTVEGTKAYVWAENLPLTNCGGGTDFTAVRYNFIRGEVTVMCYDNSFTLPPLPKGVEVFEVRRSTMGYK